MNFFRNQTINESVTALQDPDHEYEFKGTHYGMQSMFETHTKPTVFTLLLSKGKLKLKQDGKIARIIEVYPDTHKEIYVEGEKRHTWEAAGYDNNYKAYIEGRLTLTVHPKDNSWIYHESGVTPIVFLTELSSIKNKL